MLIADQVATAPCTDPVQEWFPTFEAKLIGDKHQTIPNNYCDGP